MTFDEAIISAIDGDAVVFLGAGFSHFSRNRSGNALPSAKELAKCLCEETGISDDLDLKESSEEFMYKFGKQKLHEKINEIFKIKSCSKDYSPFVKVGWRRVYTTNYDNLVEKISRDNNLDFNPLLMSDDPSHLLPDVLNCIHLNGFVEKIGLSKFTSEFKLTSTSYLTDIFINSKWRTVFNADIKESAAVIFVGYSLYDIDIEKILISDPAFSKKVFFITEPSPAQRLVRRLEKYGSIISIGTDGFLDELDRKAKAVSVGSGRKHFRTLEPVVVGLPNKTATSDLVMDLFLFGNKDIDVIAENYFSKKSEYFVVRRKTTDISYDLKTKGAVVIHAKMANGKSLFLDGVCHHLISKGYTLFKLRDGISVDISDIELLRSKKMPVLIIENYHRSIEAIKKINSLNYDAIKIVMTCRTELHEIYSENLDEMGIAYEEINLNKLDQSSISAFVGIIDQNGLFGKNASLRDSEKKKLIENSLGAEISSILAFVLKAPQMEERIRHLVQYLAENDVKRDVVMLCSLAGVLSYEFDLFELQELLGAAEVGSISYYKDEGLSQLVHMNSGSSLVSLRNPILAQQIMYIMSESNDDYLYSFMLKIYTTLDKNSDVAKYFKFAKDLSIYSSLKKIFGPKDKELIINFFDKIKTKFNNMKNQHFWLQFAIARMANKEFDAAKTLIETAYSLANKSRKYKRTG